jgi:hypothetical protein
MFRSVLQLLVTANVPPSSLILFTLMMEVIRSSAMPVPTRATWHHITEDGIIHSHRHETSNLTKFQKMKVSVGSLYLKP